LVARGTFGGITRLESAVVSGLPATPHQSSVSTGRR
jgi:hypothetical protein